MGSGQARQVRIKLTCWHLLGGLQLAYAIDDERKLQGADINQLVGPGHVLCRGVYLLCL